MRQRPFKNTTYPLVNLCKPFSNFIIILPNKVLPVIRSSFPNLDESQGTRVNDDSSDSKVAITAVTQNCFKISAAKPVLAAIGKNATTITSVIDVTVKPISLVASYAARTRFLPISALPEIENLKCACYVIHLLSFII